MLLAIAEVLLGIAQVFWEIAKSAFGNRQIHLFHKNLRGKPPLESVFQNTVRQGRTQQLEIMYVTPLFTNVSLLVQTTHVTDKFSIALVYAKKQAKSRGAAQSCQWLALGES